MSVNHKMARPWEERANKHLPCAIRLLLASKGERNLANMSVSDEQNGECGDCNLESVTVKEAVWEERCFLKMDALLFFITSILLLFRAVLGRIPGFFHLRSFTQVDGISGWSSCFILLAENKMV